MSPTNNFHKLHSLVVVACCLVSHCLYSARACGQQTWPIDGPYEPRHAYAALTTVVQDTLSLPPIGDGEPGYWFHLATTNYLQSMAEADRRQFLSFLVNQLPTSDFCISGNLEVQRLDSWYEYLLNNISFVQYEKTSDVKAAEKVLFKLDPITGEFQIAEGGAPLLTAEYQSYLSNGRNTF